MTRSPDLTVGHDDHFAVAIAQLDETLLDLVAFAHDHERAATRFWTSTAAISTSQPMSKVMVMADVQALALTEDM